MGLSLNNERIEITGIDASHLVLMPHEVPPEVIEPLVGQAQEALLEHQDEVRESLARAAKGLLFTHWWEYSRRRRAQERQQQDRLRYQRFLDDPKGTIDSDQEVMLDEHLSAIWHSWDDPALTLNAPLYNAPHLVAHFSHAAEEDSRDALKEERALLARVPDIDIAELLSRDPNELWFDEGTKMTSREFAIEQFGPLMHMNRRLEQRNLSYVALLQSVELQLGHA